MENGLERGGPVSWRVAPTVWRISHPKRGTGHEGMIRKEWGKGCPSRTQAKGRVWLVENGFPSIPMTETWEGMLGPE